MEVGWERSIVEEKGLSVLIEVLSKIESSNSMTIEEGNHSSSVLDLDIEDMILMSRGDGE